MKDQELKIFFQKTIKNPLLWFLIFPFGYKLLLDVFRKKMVKKKNQKFVLIEVKKVEILKLNFLLFVKKYSNFDKKTNLHFSANSQTDKLDQQYVHYNSRFYSLLFTNPEELENSVLELQNWLKNNPIKNNVAWHSYNVSERIVNWSIFLSRFSEYLSESDQQIIAQGIYKNAHFLFHNFEHHLGHHNHLINNARALLFATCLFEEKTSSLWQEKAVSVLNSEMPFQVLDDGVHSEQSASYHLLLTRTLWELKELHTILNTSFSFENELKKMVQYAQYLIRKNNVIPFSGHITPDIHSKELIGLGTLWIQNSKFESSNYAQLFIPNYVTEALIDVNGLKLFANSGIGIINKDDIEIHFSNDPRTSILTHGDQNPLGIDVSWSNSHVIRDCGLHSYNLDVQRNSLESWQGQSTFTLNNLNPIVIDWRKKQLPSVYFKAIATLKKIENYGFIGSHTYFKRLVNPAELSRKIIVIDDKIEITDSIKSNKKYNYNALFHFGNHQTKIENNAVYIEDVLLKNKFIFTFQEDVVVELKSSIFASSYGVLEKGTSLFVSSKLKEKESFFIYTIEKK